MKEIWKDIKGYEGLYQVSNLGNVKVLDRNVYNAKVLCVRKGRIFKNNANSRGYINFSLVDHKGKKTNKLAHRLVAETFIPKTNGKNYINHIDGNKQNNRVDNLEWVTAKENSQHATKNNFIRHRKYKMISLDNSYFKIFDTYDSIELFLNKKICKDLIIRCCNKKRKTAYGFKWEYV